MTARKIAAARVLRARRETTQATDGLRRTRAYGGSPEMIALREDEVRRTADAEKTAADAPQKTQAHGFGRNPGKGEFRRG